MMATQSVANLCGGSMPKYHWTDIAEGNVEIDNRTAEEIVNDVLKRTGLEVID